MRIKELADRAVAAANADEVLEVTPSEMRSIHDMFAEPTFVEEWTALVTAKLSADKLGVQLHVKVVDPEVGEITGTAIDMGKAKVTQS